MLSTLRRRVLRPWTVVPLVVVLGGGTWFLARSDADDTEPTTIERTVEATAGPMDQVVSASGTVEAADTEQLGFTAAGTVTAVNVAAGDEVAAGDVLATMDSPELEAAATEAEAGVADAEARLDSDEAAGESDTQIAADQSSLDAAERQLDAAEGALAGTQIVATLDGTVTQVDLAVGDELASGGTSGTDLTGSGTGSGQSSSNLGSGGQTAGPAGATGGTDTDSGDTSSTSTQIEVVTTGSYRVELGIDATEVDLIAEEQEATVRPSSSSSTGGFPGAGGFPGGGFPGGGGGAGAGGGGQDGDEADSGDARPADGSEAEATGNVTSIGAIADASSGVASFPVTVTFESTSDELTVGSPVDVEIVYERIDDAIQVPVQAVTSEGGASSAVVRTDDGDETRTVETGVTSGGMVQVTSGLEAGEQVVITLATGIPAGGEDGDGGGGGQGGGGGGLTPPPGFNPGGGGFPGGGGAGG
jgi:membrane fusion protein, macrolide-specific efflux system